MDTATQALLGAAVGQAACGRRLGRRALAWGAIAGLLPDLDVLAIATHGPFAEFLYHRGPTHALWFGPVVGPLLGWAVWRWYRPRTDAPHPADHPGAPDALGSWITLFVLALFTHPLIDVFTAYGTQLLAPFSSRRFALNGVGIIDPFYSLPLLGALVAGGFLGVKSRTAWRLTSVALVVTSLYLVYGWQLNQRAERDVADQLRAAGHERFELRVYPTLLQPWLRRVVARTDDRIRVGLHTSFRPGEVAWESFPRAASHPLVEQLRATPEGETFVWFAMGETHSHVIEGRGGTIVEIDDLRYGWPGAPQRGFWGIRGVFDRAGRLRSPVHRIQHGHRPSGGELLRGLWRATLGDFSALGLPRQG